MPIDDFDTQIQVEETIPEWYDEWKNYLESDDLQ